MHDSRSAFAQLFIRLTEPLIFSKRWLTLGVMGVLTVLLAWQAAQLRIDAGFEKQIPLEHDYIKIYKKYEQEFGGANVTLVALRQTGPEADIYTPEFMASLRTLTTAVFYMPGMDRSRVSKGSSARCPSTGSHGPRGSACSTQVRVQSSNSGPQQRCC